jgi:aminoglycoside phosphotransferase (APT) family kinase protein
MRFAPIPTGKFNTSYFVQAGANRWVLRIAPRPDSVFVFYERDMMRQEPGIHALLLERTRVPVARILGYDDSYAIIDHAYLLMERLPGRPLCDSPGVDADPVLREVGACLAQAHRLTAERYGYIGEHRPMPPQRSWVDALAMMWAKLVDDVAAAGYYGDEERALLLNALDRHLPLFDRPVPASLLHMDVWSQNILVSDDGKLTGLVDWDRALWGDPEIEFAVLDYCGISGPAFWEGYGAPRDTSREAAIRNIYYLLYEIQKYIVIEQGRNNNPHAARRYKQQVLDLARRIPR